MPMFMPGASLYMRSSYAKLLLEQTKQIYRWEVQSRGVNLQVGKGNPSSANLQLGKGNSSSANLQVGKGAGLFASGVRSNAPPLNVAMSNSVGMIQTVNRL